MDPQHIIDVCEANWPTNNNNCNVFVEAVAQALGVNLFTAADNADAIMVKLANAPDWTLVPDLATVEADASAGQFMIAGLASADFTPPRHHGHVVVVVQGDDPNHPGYPMAYWGTYQSVGQKDSSIRNAFQAVDLPNVKYYSKALPDSASARPLSHERSADLETSVNRIIENLTRSLVTDHGESQPWRVLFPHGIDTMEIDVQAGPRRVRVKLSGSKADQHL